MNSQTTIHSLTGTVKMTRLTAAPPSKQQQGFTVLESLLWLMSLISCWGLLAHYSQRQVENTLAAATARQLNSVSRQAYQGVLDHWESLLQQWEQSGPQGSLDLLPLLPPAYSLPATPNPYQQRYRIQLIPVANRWQLWVTTQGGKTISPRVRRQIGDRIGASAGYITHNVATATHTIIGWRGLWTATWPQALGSDPSEVHLATLQTIDPPELTSANQILYRKPVVGISTPNQVNTDLNLDHSSITLGSSSQEGRLNSQQWQFTQGTQALQIKNDPQQTAIQLEDDIVQTTKMAPHDLTVNNTLLFGETQENTVQLHKFLFSITETQENKEVSFLTPLKKCRSYLSKSKINKTRLRLRKPQCTAQIHPFWNKIPYHEYSPKESNQQTLTKFGNSVCQTDSDNNRAFGRLFIVGSSDITTPATLFICAGSAAGPRAFELNTVAPYQPSMISSKSNENPYSHANTVTIKLPNVLSEDDEASRCLDFLKELSEHIIFFIKSAKKYSKLTENGACCLKKDNLKSTIKKSKYSNIFLKIVLMNYLKFILILYLRRLLSQFIILRTRSYKILLRQYF